MQQDGKALFVTTESGKLIRLDLSTRRFDVLFQHPDRESVFGVTHKGDQVFLSGATFLASGRLSDNQLLDVRIRNPFPPPLRGQARKMMRWFWEKLGAHSRVIPYDKPGLHQMNLYGSSLYASATTWNEVWVVDLNLNVERRIPLQPHILDYFHLNNVFCDGRHYYVSLNRYAGRPGQGGYAKFDLNWNEVERRALGWESHAFSVIDGHMLHLCCFSWRSQAQTSHPRKAGLMMDDDLVFPYDPAEYFCKDFSMDDEHIVIVGGTATKRENRSSAAGVVFILNRQFELLSREIIPGLGGFNGCRFMSTDYSKGYSSPETDRSFVGNGCRPGIPAGVTLSTPRCSAISRSRYPTMIAHRNPMRFGPPALKQMVPKTCRFGAGLDEAQAKQVMDSIKQRFRIYERPPKQEHL